MKANHNIKDVVKDYYKTVTNINISKNESKSQLRAERNTDNTYCNKYQYFKE